MSLSREHHTDGTGATSPAAPRPRPSARRVPYGAVVGRPTRKKSSYAHEGWRENAKREQPTSPTEPLPPTWGTLLLYGREAAREYPFTLLRLDDQFSGSHSNT